MKYSVMVEDTMGGWLCVATVEDKREAVQVKKSFSSDGCYSRVKVVSG